MTPTRSGGPGSGEVLETKKKRRNMGQKEKQKRKHRRFWRFWVFIYFTFFLFLVEYPDSQNGTSGGSGESARSDTGFVSQSPKREDLSSYRRLPKAKDGLTKFCGEQKPSSFFLRYRP